MRGWTHPAAKKNQVQDTEITDTKVQFDTTNSEDDPKVQEEAGSKILILFHKKLVNIVDAETHFTSGTQLGIKRRQWYREKISNLKITVYWYSFC